MLAQEIVTYLAAAGLGLTAGTNVFWVPFPLAAPDAAVAVEVTGGRGSDRVFGASLAAPANAFVIFQVTVRDTRDRQDNARSLAYSIHKKLESLGPVTLSGVVYRDVHAFSGDEPVFIGYDANERPRYAMNYEAMKDRS